MSEFIELTGMKPVFDSNYELELVRLIEHLRTCGIRPFSVRRREFLAHVNWKFRLNAKPLARFYSHAARIGVTFHYHHKRLVQRAFDIGCIDELRIVLNKRGVESPLLDELLQLFDPVDETLTLSHLANECREPTRLRKEKGNRDIANEIIMAQFSAFMWVSTTPKEMHRYFDPLFNEDEHRNSYWEQLHARSPHLFNRDNALHVARLDEGALNDIATISALRGAVSRFLESLYSKINNYGYLAILIEPLELEGRSVEWEVAADAILFAEKHREVLLQKAYFRWKSIRDKTKGYIDNLNIDEAQFDLANEGFTYCDTFVLAASDQKIKRLLLILQKNERDETLVQCPSCRSANVQGNSYPSLGVRSWECKNVLCPDRSKYNRGKRYSFRGLLMQQAIDDDRNDIPVENVRRWMRDIAIDVTDSEIVEMLSRHYSIYGDTIHVHGWKEFNATSFGRAVKHHDLELLSECHDFWEGSFFKRYICEPSSSSVPLKNLGDEEFQVLQGDSAAVLRNMPAAIFDGAVTSPPYYNARDYAQWPNIYCYLHDMFDINTEVYRSLKDGALYLYNVFDYFDNENTIVFSAMGKRRMLLSAYTIDLFRRIGFELLGNIVWDKGNIEGKRGFNAGNFSPYYQTPFNCWEHVLIFRKPFTNLEGQSPRAEADEVSLESHILKQKPVMKMVRGKNIHGHTAPFPDEIPELLVSRMKPGDTVLDPFGGSLTTGRVAERYGVRSVCIERSQEYCSLGLLMRETKSPDIS